MQRETTDTRLNNLQWKYGLHFTVKKNINPRIEMSEDSRKEFENAKDDDVLVIATERKVMMLKVLDEKSIDDVIEKICEWEETR